MLLVAGLALTGHAVGSLTGTEAAATGTATRAVSEQRLVAVRTVANVTGRVGDESGPQGTGTGPNTGAQGDGTDNSLAAPPRPAGAVSSDSQQTYLDPEAAVAARTERQDAVPAFDEAMVGLSAAERAAGQGIRAGQALHEDNRLQQDQRSQGQAEEAAGIASEVARLEEEKRLAEEAARLAEEARLAAEQAAAAAAKGEPVVGTLVRVLASASGAPDTSSSAAVAPILPGSYQIAARFGAVGAWSLYHTGVDLGVPIGTPIRAAAAGTVTAPVAGGWAGTHVIIDHGDGSTLYAHLVTSTVLPGQWVRAGDVIGFVGMTGRTFGPHLHFEYYPPGTIRSSPYMATDPVVWMARRGIRL